LLQAIKVFFLKPVSIYWLQRAARYRYVEGNLLMAEKMYRRFCKIQQIFEKDRDELTRQQVALAHYMWVQGKFAEANLLMDEALKTFEELYEPDSKELSAIYSDYAQNITRQGRYDKAEELLLKAISIQEKLEGPVSTITMGNLAYLYLKQGKYFEAETLYQEILQRRLDEQDPEVLKNDAGKAILSREDIIKGFLNVAYTRKLLGKYPEAENGLVSCINNMTHAPDHLMVAFAWNNLGEVYLKTNRLREAHAAFLKSLEIKQKIMDPADPDYVYTVFNLAELDAIKGNTEEAEKLYLESLPVTRKAYGEEHQEVAEILCRIGEFYRRLNRGAEAREYLEKALVIQEEILNRNHPHIAETLNNLAALNYLENRSAEAETMWKRALGIQEAAFGETHVFLKRAIGNLQGLYESEKRRTEAKEMEARLAAIKAALAKKPVSPPDSPEVEDYLYGQAG
jgi:tetratricopeptide (TPR) repeat protein